MNIEFGIQPNCSELVIYLNDWNMDDIHDKINKAGIYETLIEGYYDWKKKEIGDWDDTENEKIKKITKLSRSVGKLINQLDDEDEKVQNAARAELVRLGYNLAGMDVQLLEDGKLPDYDHGGTVSIREKFYGENEPAIIGHQHCQVQIFPLMKKLSELFDSEVQGHDGGSNEEYNRWLDGDLEVDL